MTRSLSMTIISITEYDYLKTNTLVPYCLNIYLGYRARENNRSNNNKTNVTIISLSIERYEQEFDPLTQILRNGRLQYQSPQ